MKKHSVLLKEELCEGCTNCVKNCPTRAIRIHNGKARIIDELCIDCAECIRICAYHAKHSLTASLADVPNYKYPIALIPPSFYGQFKGVRPVHIKQSLFKLGFQEVLDVSLAAEALSSKTSEFLANNPGIYISSSCPVVVRLIRNLYPELTEQLIPFKAPTDAMAEKGRRDAIAKGIKPEEIGVFLITPCPGKNTTTFDPIGFEKSPIDKTIAASQAYQAVLSVLGRAEEQNEQDSATPYLGLGWGQSGGEVKLLQEKIQTHSLSVSGIHRVKALLNELSRDNIKGVRYFELSACEYGCVGGVFNVVNPFQARYDLRRLRAKGERLIRQQPDSYEFSLPAGFEPLQIGQLDSDLEKAMEKLTQLEREIAVLPGLDCAACGAPDCKTLAEDIVTGLASRSDCVFLLRKQMGDLAEKLSALIYELPPVMKQEKKVAKDR
ncbi:MAG: 4Fe-4S dicluster domain-containing protein [Firmicutes bacterium]|nr:4Fe-4S dicluster domain-containing protein [Bacillota bacterium]